MMPPKVYLDVTGMTCPMPLIQLRSDIDRLDQGDILEIRGDDPIFETTIRDFCDENAHSVVSVESEGRTVTMKIKK